MNVVNLSLKVMLLILVQEDVISQEKSKNFFGDSRMFLERYLEQPRHIEIQICRDNFGAALHLGERECSIQRRHQKILEESPSVAVSNDLRERMTRAALALAQAVGYQSVGTMEMLVEADQFYFMEVNARLQVEHPGTEMVSGLDLVELQLRIAANEPLPLTQAGVEPRGHSIECRIYAEQPQKRFLPSPGKITELRLPRLDQVRLEFGYQSGDTVTPYYDPLLGKIIAWGETRKAAIQRQDQALSLTHIEGLSTNLSLQREILHHPDFVAGRLSTGFLREALKYAI